MFLSLFKYINFSTDKRGLERKKSFIQIITSVFLLFPFKGKYLLSHVWSCYRINAHNKTTAQNINVTLKEWDEGRKIIASSLGSL